MPGEKPTKEEKLFDAVNRGNTDIARMLLDREPLLEARDEDGDTPLHAACFWGHPDVVRMLIEKGADVNARDQWDRTPLHTACVWGHHDIALMLVSGNLHGVKPATTKVHEVKLIERGADIEARDQFGHTPLDYACDLEEDDPLRQPLMEAFQELAPEACFTKFCETQGRMPGRER